MEGASRNVETRVLIHILPASDNGQVSLDLGEAWCWRGVFVCKGGAGEGGAGKRGEHHSLYSPSGTVMRIRRDIL